MPKTSVGDVPQLLLRDPIGECFENLADWVTKSDLLEGQESSRSHGFGTDLKDVLASRASVAELGDVHQLQEASTHGSTLHGIDAQDEPLAILRSVLAQPRGGVIERQDLVMAFGSRRGTVHVHLNDTEEPGLLELFLELALHLVLIFVEFVVKTLDHVNQLFSGEAVQIGGFISATSCRQLEPITVDVIFGSIGESHPAVWLDFSCLVEDCNWGYDWGLHYCVCERRG